MEGWREKRGGGWWLQIKDTPEMGRCRECSSAERDASRLWLAACVCGSQYRLPTCPPLFLTAILGQILQGKQKAKHWFIIVFYQYEAEWLYSCFYIVMFTVESDSLSTFSRNARTFGLWRIVLHSPKLFAWWNDLFCST